MKKKEKSARRKRAEKRGFKAIMAISKALSIIVLGYVVTKLGNENIKS